MIKKLSSTGNMFYFYLTITTLELMNLDPLKSKLFIKINDKIMYIKKADDNILNSDENLCIRKIRKTGSGFGIYFTKTLLDFIDVNPETDNVDINIQNETIILKKA